MLKNGKPFISLVTEDEFISSVWDPYVYRSNGDCDHILADYVTIEKPAKKSKVSSPFNPIEYKNIPSSSYLSFDVENLIDLKSQYNFPMVREQSLLFGTMRAYLGNALVTPIADWVKQKSPVYFYVKSEFVVINPFDKLTYFWLAYLRSMHFLENLPLGSGGTRPRLNISSLENMPVAVPHLNKRKEIHEKLFFLASNEWRTCTNINNTLELI